MVKTIKIDLDEIFLVLLKFFIALQALIKLFTRVLLLVLHLALFYFE